MDPRAIMFQNRLRKNLRTVPKWAEKQGDAVKSLAKWNAEPVSIEKINDASARPSS